MKEINFPKAYYLNLDKDTQRNRNMVNMFQRHGLTNYERFSAVPVAEAKKYLNQEDLLNLSDPDISCLVSHLLIIKKAIEENLDNFIVFEDDVDISTIESFNFSFESFLEKLPDHWGVVQLSSTGDFFINNVPGIFHWNPYYFGAIGYLMNRDYAKKIINFYENKNIFYFENFFKLEKLISKIENEDMKNPAADRLVYSLGDAYTVNIFSFFVFKSNILIDTSKIKREKLVSKSIQNFWKSGPKNLEDIIFHN
jgi:GR25 family glycosyltransferase involved in LPS biosynthesis